MRRTLAVVAALAVSTAAAAEPARWSADAHQRAGTVEMATRVSVEGAHMRVECETMDVRTRRSTVKRSAGTAYRPGPAMVCQVGGSLGPVCVGVPMEGAETVAVQADGCASRRGFVGTGD